jgi:SAM-dependent methyltransferase
MALQLACCMDRLLELTYRAEQTHFWFRGFRQFIQPLLARALEGVASARVLDCGCGTGSNLAMLRPLGDAYGFDLTMSGVEFAHAHGHRVARASIASIPFGNAAFDLVTSFDVFQVLPDDVEQSAIHEMARVVKPGGWLVMNVAALKVLHGRHSVLSEEVRRYTPKRLRWIVESGGFRIERLSFAHAGILPILLPVRIWHRFAARNGSVPPGESEITVPSPPVNAAMSALVGLEARVLRVMNMPIGSSLMCLAQKPFDKPEGLSPQSS